jgi:hypothetical protein
MAIPPSEHPSTVATYEVKRRRVREGLALLGALVFVGLGLWMMFDKGSSIAEKAAGALAVAFFGWCAVVIALRMRRGAAVMLSHDGIHYAFARTQNGKTLRTRIKNAAKCLKGMARHP